ncbi:MULTISPECIES: hypothetical protein [Streptomyces]|uniref:Lipoprotein n=1 Tax=Streptomyces albus (strain ATCC 21838 / DSM 41398 / FERM P-419 / JCM 4703 / NBRC 107858) TaxID=1081613 RepID=A0A0B5EV16_STRA4|nr:hypothetical protein [Streptomyces sp. SCSIO ZS0520]AJE82536.1 hypothetical protein SLNWT_2160 [Streptomyces albus]AOU76851.1 hypothetical protein SLNHY_2160 [Streptomyces albus]AYN32628.1 hypothetical protein DUI70_2125 [Streptomyces albus]
MSPFPPRRSSRATPALALCAGLGLAVAGGTLVACGADDPDAGTNGVGKLAAPEIQRKYKAAANAAGAVHISGTLVSKGVAYKLDMRLKNNGGTGAVSTKGRTFRLLRVGERMYLKADAQFWRGDGKNDSAAARKLSGMYVRVPTDDPAYDRLSGFTDKKTLLDGVLTLHGKLDKGERARNSGVRTVELTGDGGAGGILDVSLEGRPYPLELERAGNAGTIRLAEWNKEFRLAEPPEDDRVDYGAKLPNS